MAKEQSPGIIQRIKSALGFPYPAIDPLRFLVDDEIRPFILDRRHDLTGAAGGPQAPPIKSTGVFIVHQHVVPNDTAEVIMGVFPHCWQRTNPTAPEESWALLTQQQVAGWVLFNNSKNNNQPYLVEIDYNSPSLSTSPNDTDRQSLGGSTFLNDNALTFENVAMQNPLGTFYLPGKSIFQVTFQLMPNPKIPAGGVSIAVPNPWVVPDYTDPVQSDTNNRIDAAGALVFGVRMPQPTYEKLKIARRNGQLGPEGAGRFVTPY